MNPAREALTRAVNRATAEGAPVYVQRVQVPAYTDAWMMGDRFGNVVKVTKAKNGDEIAHVLMDVSNKVKRFRLLDCNVT